MRTYSFPAPLLGNVSTLWYGWLRLSCNGSGQTSFQFRALSKELNLPEQTLRKWHASAKRQGLFNQAWTEGKTQHVRIVALDKVLSGMLYDRGDVTFIRISYTLKELRRVRKGLFYQATTFKKQKASLHAVKRAGVDVQRWVDQCSSVILHGYSKSPQIWFKAQQPVAGTAQNSIATTLQVTERTVRRNLKAIKSIRVFQEVIPGDLSEIKRRGRILKRGSTLYRTRPNFYLQEDLFDITLDFEICRSTALFRRWKNRERISSM